MLAALLASLCALAQQPLTWEIRHGAADGSSLPALLITTNMATTRLDIQVRCGAMVRTHASGTQRDETVRLDFPLPPGTHSCEGSLSGHFVDGTQGEAPLRFELKAPRSISLTYAADDLDLEARTMAVRSSHPLDRIEIQVFGPGGTKLGSGISPADASSLGPHQLQWSQQPGEVVQIRLRAHGSLGEVFSLDLWPWSYQIPHDDLFFASGSHAITPEEAQKLSPVLKQIDAVLLKYGKGVGGHPIPIHLYVAGYTDTVGSSASNRELSHRRAQSIARWFRARGFKRSIFIQGFGETGLIRPTADEIEDSANRRALYMLSAMPPSKSPLIPDDKWKPLD
jgi:outer membrane protein OmpA-like peptidoglycan-associated protein